ncbi:hypothetical protein SAMN05192533_102225 [Mesobacillus persicus]|uniref:Uncharacterized protein n=1 Tax=Mesobacillus persicus TaxID=930146 RepID=A0A1H7XID0_9BACI|nr:hypothetical protein [Mesobacillus persicus]SEM33530.1 hypothetical protein SAMN05192533_102225 [Mesobacillus persicus]
MRKRYNPYTYPRWLKNIRGVCAQFAIPISVFQGIRTILFPTGFDVLLLALVILGAVALHLQII